MAVAKNSHSTSRLPHPALPAKVRVDHLDLKHLDPKLSPHLKELDPKIVDPKYPTVVTHDGHGAMLPEYLLHIANPMI